MTAAPATVREGTPWERRATLGAVNGFFETLKRSCFSPRAFWAATPPNGGVLDALIWAWIVVAAGAVLQFPFALAEYPETLQALEDFVRSSRDAGLGRWGESARTLRGHLERVGPAGYAALQTVPRGLFFPLGVLVSSAAVHTFCLLFGCGKNGFAATLRANLYASGPLLLIGVSYFGVVAALWAGVLVIWGLRELQETNEVRAALAVFSVPLAIVCVLCTLGTVSAMAIRGGTAVPTPAPGKTIDLAAPLKFGR